MASISNPNSEITRLSALLGPLLNRQLSHICQVNGLRIGGVKAELQKRIIDALQKSIQTDPQTFTVLRNTIEQQMTSGRGGGGHSHQYQGHSSAANAAYSRPAVYGSSPANANTGMGMAMQSSVYQNDYNYSHGQGRGAYGSTASLLVPPKKVLNFKPSPFYIIDSVIGDVKTCDVMSNHRNSIQIPLKPVDHPALNKCTYDKSLRIMVFCAGSEDGMQDIAFPHQSELKVNGDDMKANLRGLKGKPGSTRPVDITQALRLDKYSYVNNIEFTYALTNKKFYLAVYLCKSVPVEDLVAKIKGKKIAQNTVIQELTKAALDEDIVATSQILSLKCPLTYMRLKTPCRSISCNHIQCFDATSYLQLQEQGPQWICPICNKPATFDNLAIDEYAKGILDNTSQSTEQVTIEPDGQWKTADASYPEAKKSRHSNVNHSLIDVDDVVALEDFSVASTRNTQTPISKLNTPVSAQASGSPAGNKKRPAEVIDLTLSDSDDEPIVRPPKRQNQGPTPTPGLSLSYHQGGYHYT